MPDDFVPIDVIEAAVSAIGTVFHYKAPLAQLLRRSGVSAGWFHRYEHESKYKIARHVFADLETRGLQGKQVAIRIIQQLCAIREISDDKVDKRSALEAIARLRTLSRQAQIETARETIEREKRAADHAQTLEAYTFRERELSECKAEFYALLSESDTQKRGYALEKLLKKLFRLHDLEFRPSYKTEMEQIDGAFVYSSFDYLAEARWRREQATLAALDVFRAKVSRKLESTRGLFVSINGFDPSVVEEFEKGKRNVILMDGEDLTLVLEGRISLTDALDLKTRQAAQNGVLFARLRDHV